MIGGKRGAAAAALLAAALGACGDDGGGSTTRSASRSRDASAAFCDAALAWDTAPEPEDHEFDQEWFKSVLVPRFEQLEANAPEVLVEDLAAIGATLEGGDEDKGKAAARRVHEFAAENCGWERHDVTAVEYSFEAAPAAVDAGVVTFAVANDGDEAHVAKIVRRNDGVTTSFAELLALPEARQDELLEGIDPEAFVDPGDRWFVVAELRPGDYALVCELPVGTTTLAEIDERSGARTHAAEGMVHEFTVR